MPADRPDVAIVDLQVPSQGTFNCRGMPRRNWQILLGSTPVTILSVGEGEAPVALQVGGMSIGAYTVGASGMSSWRG